jgi:hypothetical protein
LCGENLLFFYNILEWIMYQALRAVKAGAGARTIRADLRQDL